MPRRRNTWVFCSFLVFVSSSNLFGRFVDFKQACRILDSEDVLFVTIFKSRLCPCSAATSTVTVFSNGLYPGLPTLS